jgi:hypothetical protein
MRTSTDEMNWERGNKRNKRITIVFIYLFIIHMTDSFLPTDYSMPKEGGYMKFKLPENKFRALGIPVL